MSSKQCEVRYSPHLTETFHDLLGVTHDKRKASGEKTQWEQGPEAKEASHCFPDGSTPT